MAHSMKWPNAIIKQQHAIEFIKIFLITTYQIIYFLCCGKRSKHLKLELNFLCVSYLLYFFLNLNPWHIYVKNAFHMQNCMLHNLARVVFHNSVTKSHQNNKRIIGSWKPIKKTTQIWNLSWAVCAQYSNLKPSVSSFEETSSVAGELVVVATNVLRQI
jgi:hypothetical protein